MSSHLLTEVEKTCDHVTIMDRGRIVASGTPHALAGAGTDRVEVQLDPADLAAARRVLEAAGLRVSIDPAELLRVEGAAGGAQVARLLAGGGVYPEGLVHRRDPSRTSSCA